MFHDAGYFGGVDAVALYPGSDGEEVWITDRVLVTHHPRTLHELMFDQLKAFHHVRWYFAPHCLDGCGVIRPSGAAHTMCVRDMYGRAKITIELLNLCKGERIREGGEFGVRETLCHKAQQRGGFRECAALGHQRGNAPFRVDREVFGAPLALGTEIDENGLVGRTGLFKRDVRRERTGAGSIVKPEHGVRPSIDHTLRSAQPLSRSALSRRRGVSPASFRVNLRVARANQGRRRMARAATDQCAPVIRSAITVSDR